MRVTVSCKRCHIPLTAAVAHGAATPTRVPNYFRVTRARNLESARVGLCARTHTASAVWSGGAVGLASTGVPP